jgi:hypothetical protein
VACTGYANAPNNCQRAAPRPAEFRCGRLAESPIAWECCRAGAVQATGGRGARNQEREGGRYLCQCARRMLWGPLRGNHGKQNVRTTRGKPYSAQVIGSVRPDLACGHQELVDSTRTRAHYGRSFALSQRRVGVSGRWVVGRGKWRGGRSAATPALPAVACALVGACGGAARLGG